MQVNEIYNGDAYELIKQIPDNSIDLVVTDPPYLIENTNGGKNSSLGKSISNMNSQLSNGELTKSINVGILDEFLRVMKKPNIYIWCNHKQIPMYLNYFIEKGCKFDIIIWQKPNATPLFSNKYMTDKEYCLYFRNGGYCNPKTYEEAKTVYQEPLNVGDKKLYNHPTIKPYNIIKTLVNNSSKPDDVILDPFLGSGTTAVAAKELGRKYIGFEIDKGFYKIAKDRINGINAQGQTSIFTDFAELDLGVE